MPLPRGARHRPYPPLHNSGNAVLVAVSLLILPLLASQRAPLINLVPAALAEKANDQDQGYSSRDANAPENREGASQSLAGSNGDTFMEEVVTDKPKPKPKPILIDLSRVGVSVDPHGNIVPLRDDPNDPWAASGVKPFYNHIETTTTTAYPYQIPYGFGRPGFGYGGTPGYGRPGFGYGGYPSYGHPSGYGGYPGYGSPGFGYGGNPSYGSPGFGYGVYPGYGYPGLGYGGYGGYGYPGLGYGGYPGYGNAGPGSFGYRSGGLVSSMLGAALFGNPAFGGYRPYYPPFYPGYGNPYYPGFSPFGVGYITSGNSATFLSNDPTTGQPIPPSQQGNSQSNYMSSTGTFTSGFVPGFVPGLMPGLTPGPWLAPTTSYSQNSMWKAFNLGF